MKKRRDALRKVLASDIDGVLIQSAAGRRYFTGMKSSAGTLLVTKNGEDHFIIDFRYIEKAREVVRDCPVELQDKLYQQLNGHIRDYKLENVALETDVLTVEELGRLRRELSVNLLTDDRVTKTIRKLRQIKAEEEIESIVAAQRICEQVFAHICGWIRPGMREREVALELLSQTYRLGGEGPAFDFIVGSGTNGALPHAVPGDRQIAAGDFIVMDFGCQINGYCSDMTRTVAVGKATEKMREIYSIVLKAQQAAIDVLRAGVTCKEVDAVCRNVISDAGYGEYFGHGTGHSLGLCIHEEPSLNKADSRICEPGMVFTVEPGIYLPGQFGVRIEDMLQVTEKGCVNLTKAPKDLLCL